MRMLSFCRRKAMKGRLYFATKSQKEGKIMIKTHPCAQIFCCDICGFEKVDYVNVTGICTWLVEWQHVWAAQKRCRHWMSLQSKCSSMWQQHILPLHVWRTSEWKKEMQWVMCAVTFFSAGGCRAVLQWVRGKTHRRVQCREEPHLYEEARHRFCDFPWWEDDCCVSKQQHDTEV